MRPDPTLIVVLIGTFLGGGLTSSSAQEVRVYEENGVTYRETRQRVTRPVTETRYQDRQETVYHDIYTTEMRDHHRTAMVPVTEYRWEPRWHNRWNVFVPPSVSYRLVPRTHWEPRTATVRYPITTRRVVPETRTVKVPIRELRLVEEEKISRVAIDPQSPGARFSASISRNDGALAQRDVIGGIRQMESDPPRQGTSRWSLPARR